MFSDCVLDYRSEERVICALSAKEDIVIAKFNDINPSQLKELLDFLYGKENLVTLEDIPDKIPDEIPDKQLDGKKFKFGHGHNQGDRRVVCILKSISVDPQNNKYDTLSFKDDEPEDSSNRFSVTIEIPKVLQITMGYDMKNATIKTPARFVQKVYEILA